MLNLFKFLNKNTFIFVKKDSPETLIEEVINKNKEVGLSDLQVYCITYLIVTWLSKVLNNAVNNFLEKLWQF